MNPMGKANAVMSALARETQRKIFKQKLDQVMVREHGNVNYKLYTDKKNNTYWAHIKVPSESVDKFYYDVLFKFSADAKKGTSQNLFDWNVRFFSNDPAFTYTYAYVFQKNNLLIPELKSKYSKASIKQEPKEKNPQQIIGYVKIIYFAYLIMEMKNLNKIKIFENESMPLAPKTILAEVQNAEDKIEDRQSHKVSRKKKKVLDQATYNKIKSQVGDIATDANVYVSSTKRVSKIKNVNSTVKKTKTVGKVKRK